MSHDPSADQHFDFTPDMSPAEIHKARIVQEEQRVYAPILPLPPLTERDWSTGVPQFVTDLENAIMSADLMDTPMAASEIAAELLKHPGLQAYLDLPDCEYAHDGDVDLSEFVPEDPAAIEAAHMAQLERYSEQLTVVQKGDQIGVAGRTGIDWNGHVPSEQEFLGNEIPGKDNEAGWERWERQRPQLIAQARAGIAALQELAGMAAEHKGFHEDRPVQGPELQNWQGNKLMLIVSEAVEAHDEIRTGHSAYETYYPVPGEAPGQHKPEGVPSEIADVMIRSADFAWTEGFDLADIIIEKLEYNATRGYKHGKQF